MEKEKKGHLIIALSKGQGIKVDGPCEFYVFNFVGKTGKKRAIVSINANKNVNIKREFMEVIEEKKALLD